MSKATRKYDTVRLVSSGKVRDLYAFSGIIFRTSNRVSVFDKVLLEKAGIKTDYIPVSKKFFKSAGFPKEEIGRLRYGEYLDMLKVEVIIRNFMVGSLEKSYRKGEAYCGISLPAGIKSGDKLPSPIITPTTKEESGHDMPITQDELITYLVGILMEKGYYNVTNNNSFRLSSDFYVLAYVNLKKY